MDGDEEDMHFCFIRQPEVTRITSIPKSSLPIEIKEGNFPAPVEITTRSRCWLKSEVYAWMRVKLEERDDKEEKSKNDKKEKGQ